MKRVTRFASIAVLIASFAAFALPAFALKLQQQTPCPGICKTFNNATAFPFTVRAFTFNAPSSGKVLLHFHGSLMCSGVDGTNFNFNTQIVNAAGAVPNSVGPGGLKIFGGGSGGDVPFNLASNRVFNVTEGSHTFYFRIGKTQLNGMNCFIYNASFTALLLP